MLWVMGERARGDALLQERAELAARSHDALSERTDISEEIARLKTHIEHFRTIMDEEKEVGKRLDFLTQELNREVRFNGSSAKGKFSLGNR